MVNFVISLTIAALLIAIAGVCLKWDRAALIVAIVCGGGAGLFAFVRQLRKDHRRLRELAFEDWMDRVSAIARQHDLVVMDPEQEKIWFRRFVGGLTPEQAVRQERELAGLAAQADFLRARYPGIGDDDRATKWDSIP